MNKIDPKSAPGMVADIGAALAPSFSDSDPDSMKQVGDDLGSLIDLYRGHRDELMRAIADFKQNVEGQTLEGGADAFKGEMTQATSAHLAYANALKKFAAKTGANVDATQQDQLNKGVELSGAYSQISGLPDKAQVTMPDGSTAASKEDALAQLKQQMTSYGGQTKDQLVQQNTGVYKLPAAGSYDDDGNPIPTDGGGGGIGQNNPNTATKLASSTSGVTQTNPNSASTFVSSNQPMGQQAGNNAGQNTSTDTGVQQAQNPSSSTPSSGGAPQSAPQGGGAGAPGGGAAGGSQVGGTGAMDGVALAAAPSVSGSPTGSGAGGGSAPAPSIGGAGFGGAGGPGLAGAGGSSDGQGTRASGSVSAEKPSGSQGSGSQASGARSTGPVGQGAAQGATSAQSAQQAALRQAMRGDTAGGASGTGKHLDKQQEALGTGQGSGSLLAKLTLASLAASTSAMSASLEALPGNIAEHNPFLSHEQAEARAWGGTLVTGGTVKGFGADGISWGDNPVADAPASFVGYLVVTYEDQTVAPNEEAGVFRPVLIEATSTEDFGVIRPEFDLPTGVRVMERGQSSSAPGQTWLVGHPGQLAVELVKWRIAQHEAGSKWRPVAVGFLGEADPQTVYELSQLGVESYWDGRPGFELANDDAEDKTKDATAQLAAGAASAPKTLEELVREDPKGDFDPAKLSGEHRGWHDERAATLGKDRLTNQEWANELAWRKQQRGDNNGGINL